MKIQELKITFADLAKIIETVENFENSIFSNKPTGEIESNLDRYEKLTGTGPCAQAVLMFREFFDFRNAENHEKIRKEMKKKTHIASPNIQIISLFLENSE